MPVLQSMKEHFDHRITWLNVNLRDCSKPGKQLIFIPIATVSSIDHQVTQPFESVF